MFVCHTSQLPNPLGLTPAPSDDMTECWQWGHMATIAQACSCLRLNQLTRPGAF